MKAILDNPFKYAAIKYATLVIVLAFAAKCDLVAQNFVNAETKTYRVTAYKLGNTNIASLSNEASASPKPLLYVPSAFTPNGDGINDFFLAKGEGIARFSMSIFNRWGELVFESNDMNQGWDGPHKGQKISTTEIFNYVIKAAGLSEKLSEQRGLVTLISE